jgi:hypothetical protein
MRRAFIYLLFINLLDYFTTAIFVTQQGYEVEANPIMAWLMKASDTHYSILFYKMLVIALYAGSMFLLYKRHPDRFALPFWRWVVYLFNFAYTVVVLRSLYTIFVIQ